MVRISPLYEIPSCHEQDSSLPREAGRERAAPLPEEIPDHTRFKLHHGQEFLSRPVGIRECAPRSKQPLVGTLRSVLKDQVGISERQPETVSAREPEDHTQRAASPYELLHESGPVAQATGDGGALIERPAREPDRVWRV